MKTFITAFFVAAFGFAATAEIARIEIAVAERHTETDMKRVYNAIVKLVDEAPPGIPVRLHLGESVRMIDSFETPTVRNPVGRRNALRPHMAALMQALQASVSRPDNTGDARLDLPRLFERIGPDLTSETVVLLCGSPIYRSEASWLWFHAADETVEEARWRVPSHAFLRAPVEASPFTTLGREELLSGARVYWWNTVGEEGGSMTHRRRLKDFWTLHVSGLSGALMEIDGDGATVVNHLLEPGNREPLSAELDLTQNKLEMLSFVREEGGHRTITIEMPEVDMEVREPTTSERDRFEEFEAAVREHDSPFSVGIMWSSAPVDFDLYLVIPGRPSPICFENAVTADGRFLRDFRSSTGADLEQIVLNRSARVGVEAWVNWHSGAWIEPVEGKAILRNAGRTEIFNFTLNAGQGNGGRDFEGRASSPYWTRVIQMVEGSPKEIAK